MTKQSLLIITLLLVALASCNKTNTAAVGTGNVIVLNEGGFNHGNASVSLYDPTKKVVTNNIMQAENGSGFVLGDVAQSLYLIGDTAFIVMNNSQRIVVADASQNFKYLYSINLPGASPRYFLPVGGSRAYVTELYANKIWVIDYHSGTTLKTIAVNGWTEQLVSWGGKIYVQEQTTPNGSPVHAIMMIDPSSDQIVNTLTLLSDPGSMALTDANQLFVLSGQQNSPTLNASLYNIDMASFSITRRIDFSASHTPAYIRYATFSSKLMYSDNGIYSMSPSDTVLPAAPMIASNSWNVYGLNADPSNGDIYISDALDYQQASSIMRYSQSGTLIDHFYAGIITNGFIFR